jgi:uncharacterized SAM-binding protein YcdF (DUF218 family)
VSAGVSRVVTTSGPRTMRQLPPFRSRAEICYNQPMTRRLVLSIFAGGVLGVIGVWLAGLLWFASTIPAVVDDALTHTDAIVVLTGGSERIETGFKLLSDGLADRLFVSGVGGQLRAGDLVARTRALPPELAAKVAVGGAAADTPGNAIETAAWARAERVSSIRLVTASYHMRRSLLEFHAAMPGVHIVPHAVFPATVKTDWWRWPGTASLIAREYTKFVLTWTRQNLGLGQRAFAGALRSQPVGVPV